MFEVRTLESRKATQESSGYWLHPWEEGVGHLEKIWKEYGFLKVLVGGITLILPPELENSLEPLVSSSVAILRTDLPEKEYLVRSISERNHIEAIDQTRPIVQ